MLWCIFHRVNYLKYVGRKNVAVGVMKFARGIEMVLGLILIRFVDMGSIVRDVTRLFNEDLIGKTKLSIQSCKFCGKSCKLCRKSCKIFCLWINLLLGSNLYVEL